jgi:hypothetical protein
VLVTVEAGGHAFLGHDTDVQNTIAEFVHELV